MRARRIRQLLEAKTMFSRDDFALMHQDALSLRAERLRSALLKLLASHTDMRIRQAAGHLQSWDGRMEPDRVGATLFEVFFARWVRAVVLERFEESTAAFVAAGASGLAASLLLDDPGAWFAAGKREAAVLRAMTAALDWLTERLGPDMSHWSWGRLHVLTLPHVLSGRGDLGRLLDQPSLPVSGNMHTVCNTGLGANFEGRTGAGFRLIADLASTPPVLWSVDAQSQSGCPGSPHYGDQLETWRQGSYYPLPLDPAEASRAVQSRLILTPTAAS